MVPNATMAKPRPRPHTTPTRTMTISFPNKGGKERTKRIATGISQPYRISCSFFTKGVNQLMICKHQRSIQHIHLDEPRPTEWWKNVINATTRTMRRKIR